MTINAAYALFMEDAVGSLKPGKFADLIVLSDNPLTVEPDALIDLEVLVTMVGGRSEYCTSSSEALCPSSLWLKGRKGSTRLIPRTTLPHGHEST